MTSDSSCNHYVTHPSSLSLSRFSPGLVRRIDITLRLYLVRVTDPLYAGMVRLLLLRRLLSYSQAVSPFRLFVISYRNVPSTLPFPFSTRFRPGLLFYSPGLVSTLCRFFLLLETFLLEFSQRSFGSHACYQLEIVVGRCIWVSR